MGRLQLLHKLRKMSPHEIRVRLTEKLRVRRERRLYENPVQCDEPLEVELIANAVNLVPGTQAAELLRLKQESPEAFQALSTTSVTRADAVLSGAWELLGHPVDLRNHVSWHADPRTGQGYARKFYADLPLFNIGEGVDVKYVWELGRHQYLVELARGWRFSGEEQYAVQARELMLDWIAQNRLYEGVHWTSALELAMRGIAWIWTVATLAEWTGWQADDLDTITRSLHEHAEHIEHHISYYSSPYNHLVGEAAALYLIGCVLQGAESSKRWQRLGRRVLTEHGPRQFYADGFCVEQATGYHYYTVGFMSLVIAAARNCDDPLKELEPQVHRAFAAGLSFRQPGGRWPAIGDVDSARAIPVYHDDFWNFDSLCVLGANLFHDAELLPSKDEFSEEAYWLLGCETLNSQTETHASGDHSATVLKDAGYVIAQGSGDWLCFDAGPLGDGLHADATPSTAHGHADTLQLLYRHQGRDLLVDGGMPFYFGADAWVGHFRSAGAHNTIDIDGVEMARRAGCLAWSHVAPQPQLDARLSEDVWLMRGSALWAEGTSIQRNILVIPGRGVWIADRIKTDRPRTMRWYWQMPEDCFETPKNSDTTSALNLAHDSQLQTWANDTPLTTTVVSAQDGSPVAWNAPGYGVHRKARRICVESAPTAELLLVTFLGSAPLPMEIRVDGCQVACTLDNDTFSTGGMDDQESFANAEVVWRLEQDGNQVTYAAGHAADSTNQTGSQLHGTGDWPVNIRSTSLSPISREPHTSLPSAK